MSKWYKSDRPYGSQHLDMVNCGGRVRPVSEGYEWSSWLGPPGQRVLHASNVVRSVTTAKRAAERSCRRLLIVR